jgi:hypothetical protein
MFRYLSKSASRGGPFRPKIGYTNTFLLSLRSRHAGLGGLE